MQALQGWGFCKQLVYCRLIGSLGKRELQLVPGQYLRAVNISAFFLGGIFYVLPILGKGLFNRFVNVHSQGQVNAPLEVEPQVDGFLGQEFA